MKYLLAPVFCFFSIQIVAQQNHFIYIQADNQQAFYVKLDKKIMSSTVSGYLIIPKLPDGQYDFTIGFPKNEWPEQNITCSINQADAGYLLKNFGEKGWGLFNFQTMDIVMSGEKKKSDSSVVKQNKDDAFANVLSNVVNDPGIKNSEEVKDSPTPEIKPDKKKPEQSEITKRVIKPVKSKTKPGVINNKSQIKKLHDSHNKDSAKIVYVDMIKGNTDTINIIIPGDNPVTTVQPEKQIEDTSQVVVKIDSVVVSKQPENNEEKIKVDSSSSVNNAIAPVLNETTATIEVKKKTDKVNTNPVKTRSENKKRKKKTKEPTIEIAKTDIKELPVSVDSTVNIQTKNKADVMIGDSVKLTAGDKRSKKKIREPKVEIAKNDNKKLPVNEDSTVDLQAKNKADVMIADSINLTTGNKRSKKKIREPKTEIVKIDKKEPVLKIDTISYVQTDKKVDMIPVDTMVKTETKIDIAVKDSSVITKTVNVLSESKAEIPIKQTIIVKADSILVPLVEIVSKEKKPVDLVTPEKPGEIIVTNDNPYFKKMNVACKNFVDDDEYLGLRIKMSKSKKESEMLSMAHKIFVKKCFNTRQIQRLSLLFTSDEGKYKLFDDAYYFTADLENFTSLESELKDEYFIKRFRAMIR